MSTRVVPRVRTRKRTISRYRLVLLASAVLMVPAVLVVEYLRGSNGDLLVIAGACTTLFLLVLTRMAGLIAAQRRLAIIDELTGLHTRRFLQERLRAEWAYARRHDTTLGLLLIDVDHFKWVNDSYGHPAGDRVLVELARRLRQACRGDDVVARFGGEEFAVLIAGTSPDDVRGLAERIRGGVTATPVRVSDDTELTVTVSLGAATVPTGAGDAADLIRVADAALYAAKRSGRDRVVFGRSSTRPPHGVATPDDAQPAFVADEAVADWTEMVVRSLGRQPYPPVPQADVIAVCAAWVFMRTDRDDRPALTRQQARAELRRGRGLQFDADVVDTFLRLEAATSDAVAR